MSAPPLPPYRRLIPCLVLVGLILAAYWKLTLMQGLIITDDINTSDIVCAHLPYLAFVGESVKTGQLPLWNPYIYGGFPFLAGAAGVWYPLHLLLFGVLPVLPALNILLLFTLATAAVGTFLYAREIGVGETGSLLAGIAFVFSGFMVSHFKHVTMIESVSWFPFGLYILERCLKKADRNDRGGEGGMLFLAPVFAMQNLSAFTQTAYYSAILYFTYFVVRSFSMSTRRGNGRMLAKAWVLVRTPRTWWLGGALVLGVGISAIHLLPTMELVQSSFRAGGVSLAYASSNAYDMRDILTFVYPSANGAISDATYRGDGIFWEDYGYVGVITLAAALFSLVYWKKEWQVRFFAILVVLSYLLVIGDNSPIFGAAYNIIPGMKFFRFPTRLLFVVDFGLAILGGIGVTRVVAMIFGKARAQYRLSRRSLEGALLILVTVDLLFYQLPQNPIVDARTWLTPPPNAELLMRDHDLFRVYSPGSADAHTAAFLKAVGWSGSLDPYIEQRDFLEVNTNILYGLSTPDGYIPLTPDYVVDIWGDMDRKGLVKKTASLRQGRFQALPSFAKLMDTFNVKYLILPWMVEGVDLVPLKMDNGVFVYRNPTVLPRFRLVSRVRLARNMDQARAILLSGDYDPSRQVILEGHEQDGAHSDIVPPPVVVDAYGNDEVRLRVNAPENCYLVGADTYYPGWHAWVDGEEKAILRANVAQRAVAISAGNHVVRFSFAPLSFRWGWVCSLASIMIVAVLGFFKGRGGEK